MNVIFRTFALWSDAVARYADLSDTPWFHLDHFWRVDEVGKYTLIVQGLARIGGEVWTTEARLGQLAWSDEQGADVLLGKVGAVTGPVLLALAGTNLTCVPGFVHAIGKEVRCATIRA